MLLEQFLSPAYIIGLVWLAVFLLVALAGSVLHSRTAVRARIASGASLGSSDGGARSATGYQNQRSKARFLERIGQLLPGGSAADISSLRKQLLLAGFFSPSAPYIFQGIRVAIGVGFAILFLVAVNTLQLKMPAIFILPATAGMSVIGLIVPGVYLDWRRASLRNKYRNAFPDFMDLLVVCVEAGQSLPAAFDRVASEMVRFSPEFGANLHLVNLEVRAGRTFPEALAGLHERIGTDEVKSLAVLLKQSEELGTSIANTLRVFSDEMRDKRLMRAETKAHELPVKMTLPLGLFIFPTVLMVILVPVLIRINEAFQ